MGLVSDLHPRFAERMYWIENHSRYAYAMPDLDQGASDAHMIYSEETPLSDPGDETAEPDDLQTLVERRDYLKTVRIPGKAGLGWDYSYDEREHKALCWAIDILRGRLDAIRIAEAEAVYGRRRA